MHIATLVNILDQPHAAAEYLVDWGLADPLAGQRVLLELAEAGLTLDLLAAVCRQLARRLPQTPDPDAALRAFGRYVLALRSPLAFAAMIDRDPSILPMLLAALSLGPSWADLLIADPEAFDLLRQTGGRPLPRDALVADVLAELASFSDERLIQSALRRIHARHLLRIAHAEVAGGLRLESVMQQLTWLAEALLEAALHAAQKKLAQTHSLPPGKRGENRQGPPTGGNTLPVTAGPAPAERSPGALQQPTPHADHTWPRHPANRCCVIALGMLGAGEMDYAAPLELLFVYDEAAAPASGQPAAGLRAVQAHYERVARRFVRLLADSAEVPNRKCPWHPAYRVRLVSLPESAADGPAHAAEDVAIGFESSGRTWHRQAMLKARPVAGDHALGEMLLQRLEPWLFRRYLSPPDETGIKALKRRIVMQATLHQDDWRDVRRGRGALRDLDNTVEFLQLLTGGEQPQVRVRSTLEAIAALELAGTITAPERHVLEESFVFLRRLLHRLQVHLGPEATELPDDERAEAWIAASLEIGRPGQPLAAELKAHTSRTWETLRKLLDSAFPEEPPVPREVELLLDPDPPAEEIRAALAPFGFARPEKALAVLNDLAAEKVPFLSTRRCRHHLAAILPRLLCAVSATPNPDATLDNLARVSNSLGGKGVLWELFAASPPSLDLYVRLCAASPYLSNILTTSPGMIDELVDSLQLDRLPTRGELAAIVQELCREACDTLPILHDFKSAQHLRIGVRDILGKEDIDRTHFALADVAETCLAHIVDLEYKRLVEKFGPPTVGPGPGISASSQAASSNLAAAGYFAPAAGASCRFVTVGLGKLGGRELNYHSHLDLLILYESEGTTTAGRGRQRTANSHFFTQLAQRVANDLTALTPQGRLYPVETPLRPIGAGGGGLAVPLGEFARHFAGAVPIWQWQALCQARPVVGDFALCQVVERLIRQLLIHRPIVGSEKEEIRRRRLELEKGAAPQNLERAPGGTLDVEFLVQMLQLMHAASQPQVLSTNTQQALVLLAGQGVLPADLAEQLGDACRFLRRVESGIRLQSPSARHDLPLEGTELRQLALLLGHSNPDKLRDQCLAYMAENRAVFNRLFSMDSGRG